MYKNHLKFYAYKPCEFSRDNFILKFYSLFGYSHGCHFLADK